MRCRNPARAYRAKGVDFYRVAANAAMTGGGSCSRPCTIKKYRNLHDRLLHAGQQRKMRDFRQESPIKTHVLRETRRPGIRASVYSPNPIPDIHCAKHSRRCSSCHAPMKHQHTHTRSSTMFNTAEIPRKIKGAAVAHRTQQTGELIKERGGDTEKK